MIHKDHIGQVFELGDWCAITSNNEVYVGRIISISKASAPTIARDSMEEWCFHNKEWKRLSNNWKTSQLARDLVTKQFPKNTSGFVNILGWCRAKKFVKITPTMEMQIKYDV